MPTSLRTVDVNKIELTDLAVTTSAAGASALAYDDSTGGFTFTPVNMNGVADVNTTGVTNGQTLLYDSGTSTWIVGDSVGGLASANTETDNVKSTLTYDSASGTFTFDFGNLFTANGVRTDAIIGTAATAMTITAGNDLTMTSTAGDVYVTTQSNGTFEINTAGGLVLVNGGIYPTSNNTWNIGGPVDQWADIYSTGMYTDEIHAGLTYTESVQSEVGALTISGTTGFVNVQSTMTVEGNILAADADSYDIGATATRFHNIYGNTIDAATNVNSAALSVTGLSTLTGGVHTRNIESDAGSLNISGFTGFVNVQSNMSVEGNILATDADSYDIGATATRFQNIYGNTIDAATNVNSAALSVTGLSTLTGGLLANGEIQVGVTAANEIDTLSANLILDSATGLTQVDDDMQVTGSLTVTGDLTINGTSTTVNSTTITVDDPVFTLGGDTAPGSNDALDKGIEFKWHDGAAAKVGFFGYDESAAKFTFIADATNTSETFTGTAGDVIFGAGSFTTVTASTSLGVGNDWTVALNGTNLQFLYQGTVVAQIDNTGQIDAKQDVIADSTSI